MKLNMQIYIALQKETTTMCARKIMKQKNITNS